jgi:hypothetical protein
MPDAAPKKNKGDPNVQVTLCQEDRRDEAYVHTTDVPGTHHTYDEEFATLARYDKESATATLANYIDAPETYHDAGMHADNIYDKERVATDTLATNNKETTADTLAIYDEESATLTSYDALAAYDEENAAVEGEPWGA